MSPLAVDANLFGATAGEALFFEPAFALLAVIRNLIPENFVVNRTAAMRVGASFVLIPAAVLTVVGNIAPIESVFDGVAAV